MDQLEHHKEINLMDYLEVIWKRKWLIFIPTFLLMVAVGIYSLSLPKIWQVDAIIQPSRFLKQTEQGQFIEVIIIDPKQLAGQINQSSYNTLLASKLNIDAKSFPQINAENLRDTNLIRIWVKEKSVDLGVKIIAALFNHLKSELDKKLDVEMKGIDAEIAIKMSSIKFQEIQKTKANQQISSDERKIKIVEERSQKTAEELKSVRKRTDDLAEQLKKTLEEKRQTIEAMGMLLYSAEIQNNLRYYNTLDEQLSTEKITLEIMRLDIKEKNENTKEYDTQIEKLKIDMGLLEERKSRIDFAQFIKEPTPSPGPISPQKRKSVMIAGLFAFIVFVFLAFFLDYLKKWKLEQKIK